MSDFYRVQQIDESLFRISSKENVFCELVVGKERAMLIDSGYGFGNLRDFVSKITPLPLVLVNTHGHCDHTGGNFQFGEGAYISAEDMNLCIKHNSKEMKKQSCEMARSMLDYASNTRSNILPELFNENIYVNSGTGLMLPCSENQEFDLGGLHVCVIETPGHTKGGLSFFVKEKKILYVGDEANGFVWLFDEDCASREVHINSLEKISNIDAAAIYGGHTPYAMGKKQINLYIQAAKEADYSKGIPFESPIFPQRNARICVLGNNGMEKMGAPDFAAIVIDEKR